MTTRSAVSPCSFAQAAKNATRRDEMIRESLHGQSGTRQAGRTGGSVALWRSHWMSITSAPFVWVGAKASASRVRTLVPSGLQMHRVRRVPQRGRPTSKAASDRIDGMILGPSRFSESCGDVWFRQGLVTGEREPRMPLGLVNQVAKRSTWQPPVDSRSRCLGSRVSVEATSASRVVEASSSEAAIRTSVT